MAKFTVTVEFTELRRREITVHARDEDQAVERAEALVAGWKGVEDIIHSYARRELE